MSDERCPACGNDMVVGYIDKQVIGQELWHQINGWTCLRRQLANANKRAEKAEAACAALQQWIDGLMASCPDSSRQVLLAGYRDPPMSPGQPILDELARLRAMVNAIRAELDGDLEHVGQACRNVFADIREVAHADDSH